jgi:cation diffusion facilitator CzcD-associated flavoprotein CzcO
MGAGIELDRLGLSNFVILEREDDLGGTWHANHYPGLAVDIASVTYSRTPSSQTRTGRAYSRRARS